MGGIEKKGVSLGSKRESSYKNSVYTLCYCEHVNVMCVCRKRVREREKERERKDERIAKVPKKEQHVLAEQKRN